MLAIYIIGLLIVVGIAANEYCIYCENKKVRDDYEWKQKYYDQMKINQELLDELLEKNKVKFDPDKRIVK